MQEVSRVTRGSCGCLSLPCKGRSLAGWQFMQRGCVSTLAASAKMARDRSPESEIGAKSDGDRKLLLVVGVCAELVTEPMSAAQHTKLGNDIGRIMPAPSIANTTFPGWKSSIPKGQDLQKPKPDGGRSGAERWSRVL